MILRYIYGGRLSLEEYDTSDIIKILIASIWEHVLKWGIAQNPGLPSDPSSYSKEDFITLREKVYPYKKILPKDLRENLIKHFVNQSSDNPEPMMTKEVGSKDITEEIKNPYEFNLILRGSRDGFSPNNSAYSGPSFGVGDLKLYGDNCYDESSCCNFDYEKPIRDTKNRFSVEEYEIFQIMKN
ncbi:carbohydrate-binding module family 13 protein [Rhizophagus irregularis DAOM 181602=DAOM 197198]|nr:carbohydrate-binding module family 13 protein [Rhizophagus irregularis DAOM 181602=DAOM 197198]